MNTRRLLSCVIAGLVTGLASPLRSQPSSAAVEKHAIIRRILDVTKAADVAVAGMEAALPAHRASNPNIPPVFWDRFAVRMREQRHLLVDSLVPVYDRFFTTAELKDLLRFYESPIGKRFIAVSPDIARESILVGQRWGFVIGQKIGEELQREAIVPRPPNEEL